MNRKLTATVIVALVALACAAAALAATRTYKGTIKGDQNSSVVLKVKQANDTRTVKQFVANDFLIACDSGPATLRKAEIRGVIPVNRKGKFRVSGSNAGQELKVTGKLRGKRNAKGTVRYSGPTPVDGVTESCDSGKLDWTASR